MLKILAACRSGTLSSPGPYAHVRTVLILVRPALILPKRL